MGSNYNNELDVRLSEKQKLNLKEYKKTANDYSIGLFELLRDNIAPLIIDGALVENPTKGYIDYLFQSNRLFHVKLMKRDEKLLIHVMKPSEIRYSGGYDVDEESDSDEVVVNLYKDSQVLAFAEDVARFVGFPSKGAEEDGGAHETPEAKADEQIDDVYSFLSTANLHFPSSLVTDYLLALKTKPFVILTGVSGTGKTKLAQLVAEYFSGGIRERIAFVPVRPDWTDNQGLLGFYNLITQRYEPTELLKLLLRAAEDTQNPYFLILDEMNLAKVEYYFSDFLSCLESREPILLHDQPDLTFPDGERDLPIPSRLEIPPNFYVTGTVNVDETTYMFSPKVLDRAFTLEFDRVDASAYLGLEKALPEEDFLLGPDFTLLPQEPATKEHADALSPELKGLLLSLEELLEPYRLHFGYRVINEISLYLANAGEYVPESPAAGDIAFDFCILQKVLPKLHGNRQELEAPLAQLLFFSFGQPSPDDPTGAFDRFLAGIPPLLPSGEEEPLRPRFPRSAAKVYRMWSALRSRGFVSFVE